MRSIKLAEKDKQQLELEFPQWGGKRAGAGRKPKGERAGVPHRTRGKLSRHHPVHVNVHLVEGLPSLRRDREYLTLMGVFEKGCEREGFRLVHYSVQREHVHMIVEAADREHLTRGMQGLLIRAAKALNRVWNQKGRVFRDRFFEHVLRTPREVRNALLYVLNNARRHGCRLPRDVPDRFSSGRFFDGWQDFMARVVPGLCLPIAQARTWLLTVGWRRHGGLSVAATPGT